MNPIIMNRKFWVFFIAVFLVVTSHAQNNYQNFYQSNTNISLVPPSPTAASFQKFGLTPVDLRSGLPNINVPIYEVKAGDLSLPISLSYHNNGLKPTDEAGWVGLGWNITSGGCITRIQRGAPDNTRVDGSKNFDQIDPVALSSSSGYKQFFFDTYFAQDYDTEPDVFVYNFFGHQGKFMVLNGKPYFADYERLTVYYFNETGFEIIDANGTQFVFTTVESTYPKVISDHSSTTNQPVSAWYLTSVTSADNMHWMTFNYSDYTYHSLRYLASETYSAAFGEAYANYSCYFMGGERDTKNWQDGSTTLGKCLTQIKTSEGQTIKFIQSTSPRLDLTTTENPLAEVVVYGQNGNPADTVIKRMALTYGYFGNNNSRLKLKTVYELSATYDTLNNYNFEYENESGTFPEKSSAALDDWGYYNGSAAPYDGTSLLPEIFFYTMGYNTPAGSMLKSTNNGPLFGRKPPNINYAKYGVLNKITYPTGGYTTFTYELNKYAFYNKDPFEYGVNNRVRFYKDTTIYLASLFQGDPHSAPNPSTQYGYFSLDSAKEVYFTYSRTTWDSLGDLVKNFIPIFVLKHTLNTPAGCGDDNVSPIVPCNIDTVYRSANMLEDQRTKTDSAFLQPGIYSFSLNCENKCLKTEVSINYKVPISAPEGSSGNGGGADGPGLRIAEIKDYDGVNSQPASHRSYIYTDSLNQPSGVLNEAPKYQPLITEETYFSGTQGYCQGTPLFTYNFSSDNNGIYNASLDFLFYYYEVKEITAPTQGGTYYTDHYYRPLVLPTPIYKTFPYGQVTGDFAAAANEDLLLSIEPPEIKTVSWRNTGNGYQKLSQTTSTYGIYYDKIVTGLKPIALSQDNYNNPANSGWTFNKYNIFCTWKYPVSKQVINYDTLGNQMVNTTNFTFNKNRELVVTEETINNGKKIITKNKYPDEYAANTGFHLSANKVYTPILETQIWQKTSATDSVLLKGIVTDYDINYYKPNAKYLLFNPTPLTALDNQTYDDGGTYATLLSDSHYSEKLRMNYDKRGNVMEVLTDSNMNVPTSYVWGYYGLYPVAKVVGARYSSVLSKIDTAAIQSITNDSLLRVALAPLRTISGAQATVYTYAPFVGMTSSTDINGRTNYFEYDLYNRLLNIRDINNYILKSYSYSYASSPVAPPPPPPNITVIASNPAAVSGFTATYTNTATSQVYTFTVASGGGTLGSIPAGTYNITISKSGNSTFYLFSVNCNSLGKSGTSATFSNVGISSAGCTAITIDSNTL